eukprot:2398589-Ditylum_brightwellii.AAC.1
MRGHMGIAMSSGQGSVYSGSSKQKLNTKSSTEMELIAVDDTMSHILWTTYFLECQGYSVGNAQIHQDNMSAMLLEKMANGPDKIKSREVKVKHCGAQEMLADYFTKPLQGHLFCKFCKAILNLEDE